MKNPTAVVDLLIPEPLNPYEEGKDSFLYKWMEASGKMKIRSSGTRECYRADAMLFPDINYDIQLRLNPKFKTKRDPDPMNKSNPVLESSIFEFFELGKSQDIFMIGINTSANLLGSMAGLDLIQIDGHYCSHSIEFAGGDVYSTNSMHHITFDPDHIDSSKNFNLIAKSYTNKSSMAVNHEGQIVSISHEPEVVYCTSPRMLLIQFNPEYLKEVLILQKLSTLISYHLKIS